jgi:hypothetical protein
MKVEFVDVEAVGEALLFASRMGTWSSSSRCRDRRSRRPERWP